MEGKGPNFEDFFGYSDDAEFWELEMKKRREEATRSADPSAGDAHREEEDNADKKSGRDFSDKEQRRSLIHGNQDTAKLIGLDKAAQLEALRQQNDSCGDVDWKGVNSDPDDDTNTDVPT